MRQCRKMWSRQGGHKWQYGACTVRLLQEHVASVFRDGPELEKVRRYDHPQCIYQTTWCHNYKNTTIRTYAALKSPNLFFDACVNPQKPLYTHLFRVSALLRSHRWHSAIVPIPVHVCTNTYRWGQALVLRGTDPCCFPCLLPSLVLADVTLTLLLRVRSLLRCY